MEIDQKAFGIWLNSQPPERVIESANGGSCFLCSFLKEVFAIRPAMAWEKWWNGCGGDAMPLPQWARELIDSEWCSRNGHGDLHSITVAQMQRRYRELFPEPDPEPNAVAVEGKANA